MAERHDVMLGLAAALGEWLREAMAAKPVVQE